MTFVQERKDICANCPRLKANFCMECGCFIPLKAILATAKCPLGKWIPVVSIEQ